MVTIFEILIRTVKSVYGANVGVATVFKFLAGETDRVKLNTAREVEIVDDVQSVYCNVCELLVSDYLWDLQEQNI